MSPTGVPREFDASRWWIEHYEQAPQQIIDFFSGDGIDLSGRTVADIGSGDGIIDLGLMHRAGLAKLVGYDVRLTDVDALRRSAEAAGVTTEIPDESRFSFMQSQPDAVPAPDDTFDMAISWSAFEHVAQPVEMLREVHRILKPSGLLFLQIWPLFHSRHGGHAWMAIDEPFAHLTTPPIEMSRRLQGRLGTDPTRSADDEFRSLNRLTLDSLQRALLMAHLRIAKVALTGETVHIPPQISHLPLADLVISGVTALAVPF